MASQPAAQMKVNTFKHLMHHIIQQLADEIKVKPAQISAAIELLDSGATVPFIARYRKEATQGLDDIQLRELETRLAYLRELDERRVTILRTIEEMGKLSPELRLLIANAQTKQTLEDLYLPYKTRRRTKAQIAKEAGLEPHITAMIGYPWETKAMAQNTINLAKKLFKNGYVDTLQATTVIPYPGTPLYKYCQENNLLLTKNWDDFDMRQPVIKSSISPQKQLELVQNLFKGILTPQFILKKIISIRSIQDIQHLSNYAFKYFKKLKDFS